METVLANQIGKKADFFKVLNNGALQCTACARFCVLKNNEIGQCGIRENANGELFLLVFNRPMSFQIDPIEKKPLFHFKPGSHCLGISTFGCNFFCQHCQNFDLSQTRLLEMIKKVPERTPEQVIESAIKANCDGIAYTYNEPTIFVEFALETMKLAKENGLYNVWVSNGYMTKQVIEAISPFLDAINIDLKGNTRFYKELCGNANEKFVKESIKGFFENKVRLEITNLVIPTFNDSKEELEKICDFILSISREIPLHFTAFHPDYKLTRIPPTPREKLFEAKRIAEQKGLEYVYAGNIFGEEENTNCPNCKSLLIKRIGYHSQVIGLNEKAECNNCGKKINLIL